MTHTVEAYGAYEDSGVEHLGRVPAHWEVRRISTLAGLLNGGTPSSANPAYWGGDVPWITPTDLGRLQGRRVRETARTVTKAGYKACGASMAPTGSLALSTRAPIGHLGILGQPACTNQGCRLLVPNDSIDSRFLYHALATFRAEIRALGQGSTFTELSREHLAAFRISLPPLPEQTVIVRFLDYVDRRVRRYIRDKEKLITLMGEQKQAVIHQAVTGQVDVRTDRPYPAYKDAGVEWLDRVPAHWRVSKLRRLALDRCDGPFGSGLKSSHYTEDGVRVVRLQNIGHAEFRNSDRAYISHRHCSSLGDHSVLARDLLMAGLGDRNHPAGRACVAPEDLGPAMVKADCFRFRLDETRVEPRFAALQLTATAATAAAALSTGATRQRINLQSNSARPLALPPLNQQRAVVRHIDLQVAGLRRSQDTAVRQMALLREFRTRLIADVVIGRLDVRAAAAALPEGEPSPNECAHAAEPVLAASASRRPVAVQQISKI